MNTTLNANFAYAQIDEEIDALLIGFADDEFDTQEYVLLQKTLDPSEEDIRAGFDAVYITYSDESQSMYGGISKIHFTPNKTEITLNHDAAKRLNSSTLIEINYDSSKVNADEFHTYLLQMFADGQGIYSFNI